jgi:CRISPR-associated protein Csx10
MVSTLDYIPGSVIRGILAQKYIEKKDLKFEAHKNDFFYKSFLSPRLSFTNAYLSKNDNKNIINYYPTPFSIQSEKRDENTIYDLIKKEEKREQPKYVGKYCAIKGNSIDLLHASKSINFHNTRNNRIKGCSDDGSIYNYESLDPQQEFSGRIIGEKEILEALFQSFGKDINIHIGRSKNIQYGKAELKFISDIPEDFSSEVNAFKSDDIEKTFTMTLLSSAIIYNQLGFSTASLTDFQAYLAEYLAITPESIEIEKVFKKAETSENYISIWQMKRPSETAIKAGSCFEIEIKGINDKIKELLIELQKTGIGERTNEGFGRFTLNLQMHGILENKKTNQEEEKQTFEKPAEQIPEIAKKVIKDATIKSFINYAENQALEECSAFYERFLFNWEKIPGDHNERLLSFLKRYYNIEWVKSAKIQKIDNGNKIKIYTEKNSLSFEINNEKTKIFLIISDNETYEFIVKNENGQLSIYNKNTTNLPTNSLLGKLESMLNNSNDPKDFLIGIDKLSESTKKKLERCKNQKKDLIDFIKNNEVKIPNQCIFNWNEIPGNDDHKLIDFIAYNFNIDWIRIQKFEKLNNGQIIKAINGEKTLLLSLNKEKTKVDIGIDVFIKDDLLVKIENGKQNIYQKKSLMLRECCELINFDPETDKQFKKEIHRHYWITFLRSMRKEKKKGGN